MREGGNDIAAAPVSKLRGDNFAALDALPLQIRRAIQEAITPWCVLAIADRYEMLAGKYNESFATARIVAWIEDVNLREIARFARTRWPEELGVYPPIAARSTMMTYDEARLHK